jgi:alpha-L-rhamnosidase
MVPDAEREPVFTRLVNQIVEGGHIGTGLVGANWLNRVLTDNGRADLAFMLATNTTYPSWGYMVEKGATTVWELWNGDTADPAMNSGNHVMLVGDLVIWLFEREAGIRPDPEQPGFKRIIMRPVPVQGLGFVQATHRSPYGNIRSHWQVKDHRFMWDITVPPNTTAVVYVPAREAAEVRESGHAPGAPDVKFLRMEPAAAVFEVGSGRYRWQGPMP